MALVWTLQLRLAFKDNTNQEITALKEFDELQVVGGTIDEFAIASTLPELNDFLLSLGFGEPNPGPFPDDLADYEFRFSAISAEGSIDVIGSNKDLSTANEVVSNNFSAVVAALAADSDFILLMSNIDPDSSSSTTSTSSSSTSSSSTSSSSTSSSTSSTTSSSSSTTSTSSSTSSTTSTSSSSTTSTSSSSTTSTTSSSTSFDSSSSSSTTSTSSSSTTSTSSSSTTSTSSSSTSFDSSSSSSSSSTSGP